MCAFFILMLPSIVKLSVHCSFLLHNSIIESLFPHPCVVIILVMYGEGNEASAHLPRGHIKIHQYHAINMSFFHLSSHHKTEAPLELWMLHIWRERHEVSPRNTRYKTPKRRKRCTWVLPDYMLVKRINFSIRRTKKRSCVDGRYSNVLHSAAGFGCTVVFGYLLLYIQSFNQIWLEEI